MESIDWQTWKFLLEKHLRNEKIYTFVATVVATLPVLNSVPGRLFCFYTMKYNKIYLQRKNIILGREKFVVTNYYVCSYKLMAGQVGYYERGGKFCRC